MATRKLYRRLHNMRPVGFEALQVPIGSGPENEASLVSMAQRSLRPREAHYRVSPAKIQIFALKGGNFRGLKGGKWIRVVTCPSNIRFSCLFSENFSSQAPFHYIHACILILDNLTFIFIFLRAFLAAFRVKESQIEALAGANAISSPRSSSDPPKW